MIFKSRKFDIARVDLLQNLMDDPQIKPFERKIDHDPYMSLLKDWQTGRIGSTSDEMKQELRARLVKTFGESQAEVLYDQLSKKKVNDHASVLDCPAEVQFMLDVGADSRVYVPWRLKMTHASNLDVAWLRDILGNDISADDPFYRWSILWPIFVFLRFRAYVAMSYLRGKTTVTDLGCGRLPVLALMSGHPDWLPEEINACDSDPEIAEWVESYASTPLMKGRLKFKQQDLKDFLMLLPNKSQDVIWAGGIGSYVVDRLADVMMLLWLKLKKGGTVVMDLQIKEWTLENSMVLHGWKSPGPTPFAPSRDLGEAIGVMQRATENLSFDEKVFYVDSRIAEEPVGVVFAVTKGRMTPKTLLTLLKLLLSRLRSQ